MTAAPFVLMIKPVGSRCNLTCQYCYYLKTAAQFSDDLSSPMADETLEKAICQAVEAGPGPVISFVWHGGEPTLAGLGFFRKAIDLQRRYLPAGWSFWNSLQTNGVLLDEDWCKFLAENKFDVGLSLDGTARLHDHVRKDMGGNGSFGRAVQAVRRLQAQGIQPDILCTVNSATALEPVDVYRSLRDLGTGWLQFIPVVRRDEWGNVSSDSVETDQYGRFLCAVFDEWLREDIGRLEVQLFAELSIVLAGGQASVCQMSPACGRAIVLEHDGSIFSCDHFVSPAHRLGDLRHDRLNDLLDSAAQRKFGLDKRDRLTRQCKACNWLSLCNGGCPKNRFARSAAGESGHPYLCGGLQQFFSYAENPLRRVVELRRRGYSSDVIRSDLKAAARSGLTGIGRNDACPCGSGRKAKRCCLPAGRYH